VVDPAAVFAPHPLAVVGPVNEAVVGGDVPVAFAMRHALSNSPAARPAESHLRAIGRRSGMRLRRVSSPSSNNVDSPV
jgi:hypothetical protein